MLTHLIKREPAMLSAAIKALVAVAGIYLVKTGVDAEIVAGLVAAIAMFLGWAERVVVTPNDKLSDFAIEKAAALPKGESAK